ncbi:MAG: bifunctional precorrin-2 dehydrogenase/sirohydrochlorin ferrochelatase [Armatimonadetes bacterium]|nr:bifunctional precorrin-2 dehydrogenase/sirohydrochlorin ferrochelatase [Armatimonadota bacterium]
MPYYPINLNLSGRTCAVIGGGAVAERKTESLLEYGASVRVVSPDLTPRLAGLKSEGRIEHVESEYRPEHLDGAFLVIGATDDREVNRRISEDARARGIPVNIVDDPELCTFFVPASVRRGDLVISVSTSGSSPSLARTIREELEARYGPEYGRLADLLGSLRDEVKERYASMEERAAAYERILRSEALRLLAEESFDEALEAARECI